MHTPHPQQLTPPTQPPSHPKHLMRPCLGSPPHIFPHISRGCLIKAPEVRWLLTCPPGVPNGPQWHEVGVRCGEGEQCASTGVYGGGGCHNKERGTGFLMQPLAETQEVLSLSLQQTWAEHREVWTWLTSLKLGGGEKICGADEINCLVYTAHTGTHSYTRFTCTSSCMDAVSCTYSPHTYMTRQWGCTGTTDKETQLNINIYQKWKDTFYLLNIKLYFPHIMHSMLIQLNMVNINVS